MKQYEENVKKCEEIMKAAAELEYGKYLKKDGENDVLIIKNDDGWVIGLIEDDEWIHCYEFEEEKFLRYEPMEYGHMNWALSVAKTI